MLFPSDPNMIEHERIAINDALDMVRMNSEAETERDGIDGNASHALPRDTLVRKICPRADGQRRDNVNGILDARIARKRLHGTRQLIQPVQSPQRRGELVGIHGVLLGPCW